jgi:hypothetical protein
MALSREVLNYNFISRQGTRQSGVCVCFGGVVVPRRCLGWYSKPVLSPLRHTAAFGDLRRADGDTPRPPPPRKAGLLLGGMNDYE